MPCHSRRQPNRGEGGNEGCGRADRAHGNGQRPVTAGCTRQSREPLTGENLQAAGRDDVEGEVARGTKGGSGGEGWGIEEAGAGERRSEGVEERLWSGRGSDGDGDAHGGDVGKLRESNGREEASGGSCSGMGGKDWPEDEAGGVEGVEAGKLRQGTAKVGGGESTRVWHFHIHHD